MVYGYNGNEFTLEDMKACVNLGWHKIIERLYKLCDAGDIRVLQVKEKFGGLRFYVGEAPNFVHDAIEEAEKESERTCYICGSPGTITSSAMGWLECTCNEHKKE